MIAVSRKIIHVDMDVLFASVEQRDNQGLHLSGSLSCRSRRRSSGVI